MRTIAVSTPAKATEGKMAKAKQQLNKGIEEATGLVAAGLKLGTIAIPIVFGMRLGLPALTQDEVAAMVLVAVGATAGIYWLRKQ